MSDRGTQEHFSPKSLSGRAWESPVAMVHRTCEVLMVAKRDVEKRWPGVEVSSVTREYKVFE